MDLLRPSSACHARLHHPRGPPFLPYFLVAFGFFPNSAFVRRVHPSNNDILAELCLQNRELTTIRKDIEILRKNSDFELDWVETQTDAIIAINRRKVEREDGLIGHFYPILITNIFTTSDKLALLRSTGD